MSIGTLARYLARGPPGSWRSTAYSVGQSPVSEYVGILVRTVPPLPPGLPFPTVLGRSGVLLLTLLAVVLHHLGSHVLLLER